MEDIYNTRLEDSKERLPDECRRSMKNARTSQSSPAYLQLAEMQPRGGRCSSIESTGAPVIRWDNPGQFAH
jgi:hypothetical protein